jgi:hypothetical protein
MPRKVRKKPVETYSLYIFEITDWEPAYHLSVNASKYDDGAFNEINLLQIETVCRYPEKLAGRSAHFDLYGRRGFMEPPEWQHDRNWRPPNVAHLELSPSGGRCYAPMPNESIGGLITALAHERIRYVSLHGKPLSRGRSLCWSIGFSRQED